MADMLQFELVSPERKVASISARQVQVPGFGGDFTAMPNHAPYMTTLRPGVVRVTTASETLEFVVTGGFADVSAEATTVLAEQAVSRDQASREMMADVLAAAEKALADASEDTRQTAAQRLRDVQSFAARL